MSPSMSGGSIGAGMRRIGGGTGGGAGAGPARTERWRRARDGGGGAGAPRRTGGSGVISTLPAVTLGATFTKDGVAGATGAIGAAGTTGAIGVMITYGLVGRPGAGSLEPEHPPAAMPIAPAMAAGAITARSALSS